MSVSRRPLLVFGLVLQLAGMAAAADEETWHVVGFLEASDHVVFERERARPGCLELSLEVFDARDNRALLSLAYAKPGSGGTRCVDPEERGEATARARARLANALGEPSPPMQLAPEGEAWEGSGHRVELDAQTRLPEACGPGRPARSYLRFLRSHPGLPEPAGRLALIPAQPDPDAPGCWRWPPARPTEVALRADGRRLAAVVAGLPIVLSFR